MLKSTLMDMIKRANAKMIEAVNNNATTLDDIEKMADALPAKVIPISVLPMMILDINLHTTQINLQQRQTLSAHGFSAPTLVEGLTAIEFLAHSKEKNILLRIRPAAMKAA